HRDTTAAWAALRDHLRPPLWIGAPRERSRTAPYEGHRSPASVARCARDEIRQESVGPLRTADRRPRGQLSGAPNTNAPDGGSADLLVSQTSAGVAGHYTHRLSHTC